MIFNSLPLALVILGAVILTLAGTGLTGISRLRTTNTNGNYSRWSNRNNIPYYMDSSFTAAETAMIQQAISVIQGALPASCVNFVQTSSTNSIYKIKFTPLTAAGGLQTYCYSYPGKYLYDEKYATDRGQVVSLARGASGCLTSYCQILKYLAIILGKRNEHQRGDRDGYITVSGTLTQPSAYTKYRLGDAYWSLFAYDYCSITHNKPTDFGNPAFTLTASAVVSAIPNLCTLSLTDCKLISMLYGCDSSLCKQPSCAVQAAQAATTVAATTPAVTTTPAATTTAPPPCPDFCQATTVIDEGALLLDGKQYLFSGTCYQVLSAANKVLALPTSATQIHGLFPTATDGFVIQGPIDMIWRDDTVVHVQTQGKQYACTTTTCTPETLIPKSEGVFETYDGTTYVPAYTIDGAGSTTYTNIGNPADNYLVANAMATLVTPLTTWTAAWATPTPGTVLVIGQSTPASPTPLLASLNVVPGLGLVGTAEPAMYC
ncbi:hypothetical protein BV898_15516 [Hypsibius exemplaris]|uniref:Peptidase M12A domain-containing protein n=1 Tax=Hypsibius exemplaris TaxID=2072580 RepID=A0A9X6NCY9_HYPEX|nr:hypothetical protein BV898_15516 [Hypsibius exemplaris]